MDIVTRINEEDMTVKISKILFHNCDILDDVKKTVKEATEMMLNTIVYSKQHVLIGGHNNV